MWDDVCMLPLGSPGFVYFAGHESLGPIKIGASADPYQRIRDLRTGSPLWLTLLGVMEAENMSAAEMRLHQRFASSRSHGEWFERAPELMQLIKSCRDAVRIEEPVETPSADGAYTLKEAAEILGRSLDSIRKKVQRANPGSLGRRGNALLYRLEDLV